MIMEKNWKLCERLVIGIFEDSEALIADPSQKTGEKEIDKKLLPFTDEQKAAMTERLAAAREKKGE